MDRLSCAAAIALFSMVFASPRSVAVEPDEIPLHLAKVKSMQVSGGVVAPGNLGLTLDTVQEPFITALQKKGMPINQNNYENDLSTSLVVVAIDRAGSTQYVTNLSFHYTEPCTSKRLKVDLLCPLWEHFEGLRTFATRNELHAYLTTTIQQWASEFARNIPARKRVPPN